MKNSLLLIFLFIFLVGFSATNIAQTNKSIHLNNGNVLSLPISIIENSVVVSFNGTKHLKIIQTSGYEVQIPLSDIDSISHKNTDNDEQSFFGELRIASVMGIVCNEAGFPLSSVEVRSGFSNHHTTSDLNGVFF